MLSVCLIHGGVSPHFFSERLFDWVSGNPRGSPTLSDVGDQDVEERLQKIKNAETISQAREAIIQGSETLTVLGTMHHINSLDERDSLVKHSIQQCVEGRVLRGYQQFMEGLSTLGLAEAIQSYPAHFRSLFVENTQQLSAENLINLFHPVLSSVGSSRRREESRVLCYWRDWLIDIEECANVKLEDILIFASGLSRIPPLGFPVQPALEFLHSPDNKAKPLPEANTCSIILRLPIHKTYTEFKTWMESGIIQAPTFGVV
ncbi:putative G2/M phase-specific E3 ubiquitin-protein ligase-like [Triplophysa rosa]|uniref:G2/M phase-specific E3 ubiquitin-protein ligase-like n=1 Tax=Triplophysa rosa TaxID=992332 RepID=A0A9W8C8C4_TRIRA|nr:putative G2/M phase-specific E3 ubiquitin-protein ligase-like [Triplophysa rosa]